MVHHNCQCWKPTLESLDTFSSCRPNVCMMPACDVFSSKENIVFHEIKVLIKVQTLLLAKPLNLGQCNLEILLEMGQQGANTFESDTNNMN